MSKLIVKIFKSSLFTIYRSVGPIVLPYHRPICFHFNFKMNYNHVGPWPRPNMIFVPNKLEGDPLRNTYNLIGT